MMAATTPPALPSSSRPRRSTSYLLGLNFLLVSTIGLLSIVSGRQAALRLSPARIGLHRSGGIGQYGRICRSASTREVLAAAGMETPELIKIFGRLADKEYVLENVEKTAASGYGFASYISARPKWIVCYEERKVQSEDLAERTQQSKWSSMFGGSQTISKEDFAKKFKELRFSFPLGPGFLDIRPSDYPSEEAMNALWAALSAENSEAGELSKEDLQKTLKQWSADGGETVQWEQFQDSMNKIG